ncbi:MAG: hypothetical protein GX780_02030 [Campylobacteraceae bacterium]|nr:hypothetical protein [Campylobacteraceae bacterium]
MLSSTHIVSLEARWRRWKIKRYLKLSFAICILFFFLILAWYGYSFLYKQDKILAKVPPAFSIAEKSSSLKNEEENHLPIEPASILPSVEPPVKQPELSIQALPSSDKRSTAVKRVIAIPKSETIGLMIDKEEGKNNNTATDKKDINSSRDKLTQLDDSSADIKSRAKIHIDIKPTSSNTTKYLKEKFDVTGNIVFALMIADEYYSLGEYENALRWALTANEMNPKNERSWILFAMIKAKLNRPQEAIMALEEYLKTNNSGKIESLLISLKRGTF